MHIYGTGNPLHMIPLVFTEAVVVFGASSDTQGYVIGALVTGVFTTINGLLLAYFQHKWSQRSNERKNPPKNTRSLANRHRVGGRRASDPGSDTPRRRPKGKN